MLISYSCEVCSEFHWYEMCEVLDVVESPELKHKLIERDVTPFKCKTCGHETGLEDRITFMYWVTDWLGIVLPTLEGVDEPWLRKQVQYLVYTSMPERKNLPTRVIVFGDLDEFIGFLKTPHGDADSCNTIEVLLSFRLVEVEKVKV